MEENIETIEEKETYDHLYDADTSDPALLKVASETKHTKLVNAIIKTYRKHGYVKLKAIGGGCTYKAYMAAMDARAKMITLDTDLIIIPNGFIATMPDGKIKHGALMVVERR